MKKSLLALAVLGAFAGAASAQSSVTLYGTLDVSGKYVKNDGSDPSVCRKPPTASTAASSAFVASRISAAV